MGMRQATLDILDAALRREFGTYARMKDLQHHKMYSREVVISPRYWRKHFPAVVSRWQWVEVRYRELEAHLQTVVSADAGLYYFFVRPDGLVNALPKFVFYVGISNERGSNRPLKARLRDYLNLEKVRKRSKVHHALEMYYPCVWVAYSLQPISSTALETIEKQLHGYFQPWASDRDFPVKVKRARKAWQS
jgi:hypothetical protein